MYFVYCLQHKKSGKLYYGYTENLRRRHGEHGKNWELVCYEAYKAKSDAQRRERKLKHYGQSRTHLKNRAKDSMKK